MPRGRPIHTSPDGRYGYGAARRSPPPKGDERSGAGRGASGPPVDDEPDARGLNEGGRHGRTRTTGTAGGPRATK